MIRRERIHFKAELKGSSQFVTAWSGRHTLHDFRFRGVKIATFPADVLVEVIVRLKITAHRFNDRRWILSPSLEGELVRAHGSVAKDPQIVIKLICDKGTANLALLQGREHIARS